MFCLWFKYEVTWYIPDDPRSYTHSMLRNDEKFIAIFNAQFLEECNKMLEAVNLRSAAFLVLKKL